MRRQPAIAASEYFSQSDSKLDGIKVYCIAEACHRKIGKTRVLSLPNNRARLFLGKNHPGWEFGEGTDGMWVRRENDRDLPNPEPGIGTKFRRTIEPHKTEILCICGRQVTLRLDTLLKRLSEASELGRGSIYI